MTKHYTPDTDVVSANGLIRTVTKCGGAIQHVAILKPLTLSGDWWMKVGHLEDEQREKTENADFVHDHSLSLEDDAMREAMRRYGAKGDVQGALIFYRLATSPFGKVTPG